MAETAELHHRATAAADSPSGFRDPTAAAAREVSIKLLREILEFQQRLNHMAEIPAPDRQPLVNAWRRAIRLRREMLRDLPEPDAGS